MSGVFNRYNGSHVTYSRSTTAMDRQASASYTFTLTGKSSELSCNFNPPIFLNESRNYELSLLNFDAFNSIANVDESNNLLHYIAIGLLLEPLEIPVGTYDVDDIAAAVNKEAAKRGHEIGVKIKGNHNTQKTTIKSSRIIDFTQDRSVGSLLGFKKRKLRADVEEESDNIVNINKVNALQIYCNLINGSYNNGQPVHVLYHFFPNVPAGFKIIESPQQPIYLPVTGNVISTLTVRVLDQDGNLVNFRGEEVTIRLHLRSTE